MRIVEATALEYHRPLDGRSWNPVSRWTERRAPLLLLRAEDGTVGCGEAWSRQDDIGLAFKALERYLASHVVGRAFFDAGAVRALAANDGVADCWADAAARSAVDIALWDLLAQSSGTPARTREGRERRVRAYASGGLYRDGASLADLASEISAYRAQGFCDIKIKVGGQSLERDLERIATARAAMSDRGTLWVDAVNQLDPASALDAVRAFREAGAAAIQAPVAFDDYATMARLREVLPVIAGEAEFAESAFARLLAAPSVSLLQLNPGLCGGMSGATRIAAMAARHAVGVTVQAHGTAVLKAASLQWGAAHDAHNVEYHKFHDHLDALLDPAMRRAEQGVIALPDRPGLGITLPHEGPQPDGGEIRTVFALQQDKRPR